MSRHDARSLETLVQLRKEREERLTEALVSAAAALRRATAAEAAASEEVELSRIELETAERCGDREVAASCTAAMLAERAAFHASLAVSLESALKHLVRAGEVRRAAELDHLRAQRTLGDAATERVAAERQLARLRRAARHQAEERMDEEMTEAFGSGLHHGEDK